MEKGLSKCLRVSLGLNQHSQEFREESRDTLTSDIREPARLTIVSPITQYPSSLMEPNNQTKGIRGSSITNKEMRSTCLASVDTETLIAIRKKSAMVPHLTIAQGMKRDRSNTPQMAIDLNIIKEVIRADHITRATLPLATRTDRVTTTIAKEVIVAMIIDMVEETANLTRNSPITATTMAISNSSNINRINSSHQPNRSTITCISSISSLFPNPPNKCSLQCSNHRRAVEIMFWCSHRDRHSFWVC